MAKQIAVPTTGSRKPKADGSVQMNTTKLRACYQCNIVLSEEQFAESGCPNCPDLHMDGGRDAIWSNTTNAFRGMAVVLNPKLSWVARYNGLHGVPGAYAIH